jgi:hypothetical protein
VNHNQVFNVHTCFTFETYSSYPPQSIGLHYSLAIGFWLREGLTGCNRFVCF